MEQSQATMRGSTHSAEANAAAAALAAPRPRAGSRPDDDLSSYNWMDVASGIVLAGGAYPIVIAATYAVLGVAAVVWSLLTGYQSGARPNELFGVALGGTLFAAIVGGIGLIWSGIVTLLTMPLVYLFVRSLRIRANVVWFGAVWGGLVGFLAVMLLPLVMIDEILRTNGSLWPLLIMLAVGPGLATILGQLGGAWGGRLAARRRAAFAWARPLSAAGGWDAAETRPSNDGESPAGAPPPRFQFGIRHLLWVTVWLSLLLSVIRLVGIPFEYVLPLLVGWLVY